MNFTRLKFPNNAIYIFQEAASESGRGWNWPTQDIPLCIYSITVAHLGYAS